MVIFMKKKILLRGALGIPVGIAIGYVITVLISAVVGEGRYFPCVPQLIDETGSELNAVILQTILCALLGAVSSAISVIWEIERWSIVRQTGVFFLALSLAMMPTAYFLHWMERSAVGFLRYFGIFAAIFAVIWLVMYAASFQAVKKMNKKLK